MKKYNLMKWFVGDDYPNLLTGILLWIWKRNTFIGITLTILLGLIELTLVFGYWILIIKKLGFIISFPIWMYLTHIYLKYITESGDQARRIYHKKTRKNKQK